MFLSMNSVALFLLLHPLKLETVTQLFRVGGSSPGRRAVDTVKNLQYNSITGYGIMALLFAEFTSTKHLI